MINKNTKKWKTRLVIGTPATGLVRIEWHQARMSQVIPTNWSQTTIMQFMSTYIPLEYQVADAYNLIAKVVVEQNAQWLICHEHDNVLPLDAFVRMNQYMIEEKYPVVSGLYFTKSDPPEPILYRGIGTGHYDKWKLGDKVWVDGVPMGFLLIHGSIIQAMWKESPEYVVNGQVTRKVFETPNGLSVDPVSGSYFASMGTQDLQWCQRVIKEKFLEKSGWKKFQNKEFPFLVDTNIRIGHIDTDGRMFPLRMPKKFIK
jgi:hypothetical protein